MKIRGSHSVGLTEEENLSSFKSGGSISKLTYLINYAISIRWFTAPPSPQLPFTLISDFELWLDSTEGGGGRDTFLYEISMSSL